MRKAMKTLDSTVSKEQAEKQFVQPEAVDLTAGGKRVSTLLRCISLETRCLGWLEDTPRKTFPIAVRDQ